MTMRTQDSASLPPHQILGVASSASLRDVKRAFREQALRWHPDKRPRQETEEEARAARSHFMAIHTAFRSLSKRAKLHHGVSVPFRHPPDKTAVQQPVSTPRGAPVSRTNPTAHISSSTIASARTAPTSRRCTEPPEADTLWDQFMRQTRYEVSQRLRGPRAEPKLAAKTLDAAGPPESRKRRRHRSTPGADALPKAESRSSEVFAETLKKANASLQTAASSFSANGFTFSKVTDEARVAFANAASRTTDLKQDGIATAPEEQAHTTIPRVEEVLSSAPNDVSSSISLSNGASCNESRHGLVQRVSPSVLEELANNLAASTSTASASTASPRLSPHVSKEISDSDSGCSSLHATLGSEHSESINSGSRWWPRDQYFEKPRSQRMAHLSGGRFFRSCSRSSRKFNIGGVKLSRFEREEEEAEARSRTDEPVGQDRLMSHAEKMLAALQRQQALRETEIPAGNASSPSNGLRAPTADANCIGPGASLQAARPGSATTRSTTPGNVSKSSADLRVPTAASSCSKSGAGLQEPQPTRPHGETTRQIAPDNACKTSDDLRPPTAAARVPAPYVAPSAPSPSLSRSQSFSSLPEVAVPASAASAVSSESMKTQEVRRATCSVHGLLREVRFLEDNPNGGGFKCKHSSECPPIPGSSASTPSRELRPPTEQEPGKATPHLERSINTTRGTASKSSDDLRATPSCNGAVAGAVPRWTRNGARGNARQTSDELRAHAATASAGVSVEEPEQATPRSETTRNITRGNSSKSSDDLRAPTASENCNGANIGFKETPPAKLRSETTRSGLHSSSRAEKQCTPMVTCTVHGRLRKHKDVEEDPYGGGFKCLGSSPCTAMFESTDTSVSTDAPAKVAERARHREAAASVLTIDIDEIRSHAFALGQLAQRFCSGIVLDSDVLQAMTILQRLRRVKITEDVLRETQIGSELNKKVWRSHKSKLVATEATLLVKQWRSDFLAERAAKDKELSK